MALFRVPFNFVHLLPAGSRRCAAIVCSIAVVCATASSGVPSTRAQSSLALVLPVYNNTGVQAVTTQLGRYLRSGDTLLIVSGNTSGTVDTRWVNQTATTLKSSFPTMHIVALTSGLANIQVAATELHSPIEAIAYDYEPNHGNEPEFSWNFTTTMSNLTNAASVISQHGFGAIGAPTGRPILETDLQIYNWNYGTEGKTLGTIFAQTQTDCKSGLTKFQAAVTKVADEYAALGLPQTWLAQVTANPADPNGVTASVAAQCAQIAQSSEVPGVTLWWAPTDTADAARFLQLLGR